MIPCTSLLLAFEQILRLTIKNRFVSAQNASTQHLAFVDSSTNRAIMKVDNTSFVPWNEKRDSVRISTKDTFGVGTVWAVDLWHAPYGVSLLLFRV